MTRKPHQDTALRIERLQVIMQAEGIDALLLASNVALLYTFGQIYAGVAYIPSKGNAHYFIRRPQSLGQHAGIHYIRKIEDIANCLDLDAVSTIALEIDELSYSEIQRQQKLFANATIHNATSILRRARMTKTPLEIEAIREAAIKHMNVYKQIPSVYRPGMTDLELQIEIERLMRIGGSSGLFRCFGSNMEIHMGSLLAGDNASNASPYDFALGGAGTETLPLGANGTQLKEGMSIMLDMAGNYGTYLTDISRTYSIGRLSDEAYRLHELSRRMHREIMQTAKPGTSCGLLHTLCLELAEQEGAKDYFMGLGQQAQFVGHGLGLQINEMPVLTARSKEELQEGMIIAFEPKFVLPHIGAVGIENTYLITHDGVENLSPLEEEIIDLSQV